MNPELQKTLQELADKLGTTVDRLWACLLKQAVISSAVNIVVFLVMVAVFMALVRCVKEAEKKRVKDDDFLPVVIAFFAAAVVVAAILLISLGVNGEMTLAGFFNRDYWALYHVLHP